MHCDAVMVTKSVTNDQSVANVAYFINANRCYKCYWTIPSLWNHFQWMILLFLKEVFSI